MALLAAMFLAAPVFAPAQPPAELDAEKLQAGVFANVWNDEAGADGPCAPPPLRLEDRSDEVRASLLTRFGFTYMLSGGPAREHPLDIVIHHPAMQNPATEETLTRQVLEVAACPGTPAFAGWSFTSGWELVPGEWTVELQQGGRKLAAHTFQVTIGSEFPQMQMDYSLLPEDEDAIDALFLTPADVAAYLRNAGLGDSRMVGIYPDADAARQRADQCRNQGQAAGVVRFEGMPAGGFLVECVDFTQLSAPSPTAAANTVEVSPTPDAEAESATSHPSGNVTLESTAREPTAGSDSALATKGKATPLTRPAGGYAVLYGMSESDQAANRYAAELAESWENTAQAPQVRRLPGQERQHLYGVLGAPQSLADARRMAAAVSESESVAFVVLLEPLQALARGEGRTPGAGEGAVVYDPSMAALTREVEAQALEALQAAEQQMQASPTAEEISQMPEDPFESESEEQDPRSWKVGGQRRPGHGLQSSPPVSMPAETGVDVLVARTDRRYKARRIAEKLREGGVEAQVRRLGPGAYEVRVEDIHDPRSARQMAEEISVRTGRNATVVLAGKSVPDDGSATSGDEGASVYAVQVASTRVRGEAERHMETLRGKGYDPRSVEVPGSLGAWFSVRIGVYESLEEAERAAREFSEAEGVSAIVVEGIGE